MTLDNRDELLLADVHRRTGVATKEEAAHILDAVADALGELFTAEEARIVGPYVSDRLARLLAHSAERHSDTSGYEGFVEGIEWRENVDRTIAIEHATAVCEAIASLLPLDVRNKLRADLPAEVVAFVERARERPEAQRGAA
ncbi:MAG: DUF2267 domain-containing protein [Polyangiaceae bacterium]|nr:DUF2267 domain-containing protein [Polyangiaceae bacterium]